MQLTRSFFLSIAGFGLCSATDLKTLLTNSANNWSPNLTISFPGSSAFTNATDRWTVFDEPTFIASVTVGNEADVVKLVSGRLPVTPVSVVLVIVIRFPSVFTYTRSVSFANTLGR